MLGNIIRITSQLAYHRKPLILGSCDEYARFKKLKIAIIADDITMCCIALECQVRAVTPSNLREVLVDWNPDLFFVESAFHGERSTWRYRIGKHSKWFELQGNKILLKAIRIAQDNQVKTVFWNKDDGAFFNHFIDSAKHFEYIFTSDEQTISSYKEHAPRSEVYSMSIPYQPRHHFFDGFNFIKNQANFVGSYYSIILSQRQEWQKLMFTACVSNGIPLDIYDRQSKRLSRWFEHRYPKIPNINILPSIHHTLTADVYKKYPISLNINSVTDSPTMYSRRVLEILACGGILVSNPSLAMSKYFKDYSHTIANRSEANELFSRLKYGPSAEDLERARAGSIYVAKHHTWEKSIENIVHLTGV